MKKNQISLPLFKGEIPPPPIQAWRHSCKRNFVIQGQQLVMNRFCGRFLQLRLKALRIILIVISTIKEFRIN
jgi:hypothetical protein